MQLFLAVECALRVVKDFESNYPETLLNAFLVNSKRKNVKICTFFLLTPRLILIVAPTVFWQAFKFVKPVLAGNTLAKIHIFDSDKTKWTAALLEHLPKGALSKEYGGDGLALDIHF